MQSWGGAARRISWQRGDLTSYCTERRSNSAMNWGWKTKRKPWSQLAYCHSVREERCIYSASFNKKRMERLYQVKSNLKDWTKTNYYLLEWLFIFSWSTYYHLKCEKIGKNVLHSVSKWHLQTDRLSDQHSKIINVQFDIESSRLKSYNYWMFERQHLVKTHIVEHWWWPFLNCLYPPLHLTKKQNTK